MKIADFGPVKAHALTDDQRGVVADIFGSGLLPEDSSVELTGDYLVIEHFNLDRFIERCPDLDPRLIGTGELRFPLPFPRSRRCEVCQVERKVIAKVGPLLIKERCPYPFTCGAGYLK